MVYKIVPMYQFLISMHSITFFVYDFKKTFNMPIVIYLQSLTLCCNKILTYTLAWLNKYFRVQRSSSNYIRSYNEIMLVFLLSTINHWTFSQMDKSKVGLKSTNPNYAKSCPKNCFENSSRERENIKIACKKFCTNLSGKEFSEM